MEIPNPNAAEAVGAVAGIATRVSAKSKTQKTRVLRILSPFPANEFEKPIGRQSGTFEVNRTS